MKVFNDDGAFSHWAVNLHVAPLPDEAVAVDYAERLMKRTKKVLNLDQPFPELQRAQ